MNILLTGGSGFIGRNIREHFSETYIILAPGHQELDLLDEDQVDKYFIKHEIDAVIHSAVKPGHRNAKDLSNLFYSNARMYFNLARQSENFGKMIVLGSGAVYDTSLDLHKVSEDFYRNRLPVDEHGFCKYVCARDIEKYKNIVELRLFGVFGKYEDYTIRFISNAICKTLFDMPITIKQNRIFDYLFINDLMPIIDYFINHDAQFSSYNVTPDNSTELIKLAETVREISEKDLPILVGKPGMGLEYSGDNTRLRGEIPNIEFTAIRQAVAELYQWYSSNRHNMEQVYLWEDK